MKNLWKLLAFASLAVCLAVPVLFFRGDVTDEEYKTIFLIASLTWFATATLWARLAWRKEP